MILHDTIATLSYYNTPDSAPCYCEQLTYPGDLTLQGQLYSAYTSGYTVQVNLYSPDGLTDYGDVTSYFGFYVAQNPVTGGKFFNLKLNSWAPAMCIYRCWILRIKVFAGPITSPLTTGDLYFDKYTDKYCQSACCDVPRDITFEQEDVQPGPQSAPSLVENIPALGPCGVPLLRIVVNWPCYDPNTGLYYGTPGTVYTGTASFPLTFILNLPGRIVKRPRTISIQRSYNCKLQRAESTRLYLLEGQTEGSLLPAWKMDELENAFHAPLINIDGIDYRFPGGEIVRQVYKCWELFKLEVSMQDCAVRVDHSCSNPCSNVIVKDFVVPPYYQEKGFLDENRMPFADLETYWDTRPNVTDVTDVTADYEDAFIALRVTADGPIPSFFYFDSANPANRVFGSEPDTVSVAIACAVPVIGTITFDDMVCETPTIGTVTFETDEVNTITFYWANDWVNYFDTDPEYNTIFSKSGNLVQFQISAENTNYTVPPEDPLTFDGEVIGSVSQNAWPTVPQYLTLSGGARYIGIDTSGVVRYYGIPTTHTATEARIVTFTQFYSID